MDTFFLYIHVMSIIGRAYDMFTLFVSLCFSVLFLLWCFRCAIFQEDCKVVSGPPPQIFIKLRLVFIFCQINLNHDVHSSSLSCTWNLSRPYSKDMGFEDLDVTAQLLVRLVVLYSMLFLIYISRYIPCYCSFYYFLY